MKINNFTLKVKGLKKEYKFLHITDLHLLIQDEDFSKEKSEVYARREKIHFTRNGTKPQEKLTEMVDYAAKNNLMPIFSGDILDFPSKANFAFFDKELSKAKDYFFVLGNHDWTYMDKYQGLIEEDDYRSKKTFDKYYHLFDKYVKDGSLNTQKMEFDDLIIFGLDTHDSHIDNEQVQYFKELIKLNKPVLVVGHAPFFEEGMDEVFQAFAPGYLKKVAFGQKDMPMGENEKNFKELLVNPKNNIVAYLCGHAHVSINNKIGGIVPQFLLGGSYEGEVNQFTLVPEK